MKIFKRVIYFIWWLCNWFAIVFTVLIIIDYLIDRKIEFKSDIIAAAIVGFFMWITQVMKSEHNKNNPPGHHIDPLKSKT